MALCSGLTPGNAQGTSHIVLKIEMWQGTLTPVLSPQSLSVLLFNLLVIIEGK